MIFRHGELRWLWERLLSLNSSFPVEMGTPVFPGLDNFGEGFPS